MALQLLEHGLQNIITKISVILYHPDIVIIKCVPKHPSKNTLVKYKLPQRISQIL